MNIIYWHDSTQETCTCYMRQYYDRGTETENHIVCIRQRWRRQKRNTMLFSSDAVDILSEYGT